MTSLYFTGSSGTGKTTLSLSVSSALKFSIVDGISRSSPFLQGSDEHQQYVSRRVFRKCVLQKDKTIHCRTPIDVMAYTTVNNAYSPMDDQHCRLFAATNPIVVYFPMLHDIEDDGVRPTDRVFNENIAKQIKASLDRYNIKYLRLEPGKVSDRVSKIIEYYLEERNGDAKTVLGNGPRIPSL